MFKSRLPAAKSFKKWLTSKVFSSIRKTGGYELQAIKKELVLRDQELDKAMEQLSIKDAAIEGKDAVLAL